MITVKQVLENYDILTEKADNDSKNLVALVHAGLLDESQLPILRRAMSKPAINMTEAEKKALHSLVESVSSCIISEKQDYLSKLDTSRSMGYPPEKDIPAVIILKRKAIRVYPDNQKVALYYSQALDRYISIPYGKNSKALDMTLNEERLNEISQEIPTRAYVKRTQRIKDIQDDSELSPEQKAMAITAENKKRKMLAQRMMTNVADRQTGKPLRPWAGKEAVKTAKLASKMSPAKPIDDEQIRKMTAKERSEKGITFGQASNAAISSGGDTAAIVGAIAGMGLRRMVGLDKPKPKPKTIMKESFRKKLEEKRQEKQLDEEGAWDATKAFAGNLASSATFGGSDYIGRKLSKNWDAERERLDKEHSTAATVGDIAGYAVPGLGALKGAKLAAKGVKAGAEALSKTKVGKYARVVKRRVGGKLAGAASLAGAAASALGGSGSGSDEPLFKRAEQDRPGFGNIKPQVSSSQVDPMFTSAGIRSAQQAARIQSVAFKESNNLNILKQMVEHNISSHVIHINETPITINNRVAKKVVNVYESLNRQNKKKVEKMLNEDATSLKKVINFAVRQ